MLTMFPVLRMMRFIDRIHCDISPGNIFVHPRSGKLLCNEPWKRDLRAAYTVKVADFEHTKAYSKASPEDSYIVRIRILMRDTTH